MSFVGRLQTAVFSRRNKSLPENDEIMRQTLAYAKEPHRYITQETSFTAPPAAKGFHNDFKNKPLAELPTLDSLPNNSFSPKRRKSVDETQEIDCLLSDPELPLLSEIDHKIGKCYCHLCECGKHICPSVNKIRFTYNKGNFLTSYKMQYDPRDVDPTLNSPIFRRKLQTQGSTRRTDVKMDLTTTKQQDFQLPSSVDQPKPAFYSQATTTRDLKFTGRSAYQVNFPNWGPNEIERMRHASLPYRGDEIKFNPRTTYGSEFRRGSLSREVPPRRKTTGGIDPMLKSPISPSKNFFAQTTTGSTYRDHTSTRLPTRKMIINEEYSPVVHSPSHFDTIYRNQFNTLQKSPNNGKKQLE
jgi:hypothetical protein